MPMSHADISVAPSGEPPKDGDLALIFNEGGALLCGGEDEPRIPEWGLVRRCIELPAGARMLEFAKSGDTAVYSPYPSCDIEAAASDELHYRDVRAFMRMPEPQATLLPACRHLWRWYANNRYCGRCGGALSPSQSERALVCPDCGNTVYPMIAPAVIVAIVKDGKLLLARNRHYVQGLYTLIAGFVEVGETLEQTVRREVMEEVGLKLGAVKYLDNQPWGVSGSLMLAYRAEAVGDDPIRVQESELSDAYWFERDKLPQTPGKGSVAAKLIDMYKRGEI